MSSLVWERQDNDSLWHICLKEEHSHVDDDDDDNHSDSDAMADAPWQTARQDRKDQHAHRVRAGVQRLQVVYEDEHVVVVNKPGGVLTVPGARQHASLSQAVHEAYGGDAIMMPEHRIVHRLDMDTSGLVMFGRSLDMTKALQKCFRERIGVRKQYRAVVVGHWPVDAGTVDLPLQRDIEHAPFMRVSTATYHTRARRHLARMHQQGQKKHWVYQAAKDSVTHFQVVRRGWYTNPGGTSFSLPYTVLNLEPHTGRTHQLRVHCAAVGFPILGDTTYGWHGEAAPFGGLSGITTSRTFAAASLDTIQSWNQVWKPNGTALPMMCLHAASLELAHPLRPDERISCDVAAPFESMFGEDTRGDDGFLSG